MSAESMRIEPIEEKGLFESFLPRPVVPKGLIGWLTTVDHKRIGILYGLSALFYLCVGGLEGLTIRAQLAQPNEHLVSPNFYDQLFTMHGTTMIFLVVMPLAAAFFNFIIPLQIGARDVAMPRLNAFSYWMFLAGSVILNLSWFLGGAPNDGWFGYANLTSTQYSPGHGVDFWIVGLQILGISSIAAALNFITTIINLRAPGMTFMRLPVFTWMTLVTAVIVILAFPVITIALVELMMDRMFGTGFFAVAKGGLPILWQHLFWIFGHPEVYILILPPMGIVSEIIPTFSRKPLFGYPLVVGSGAAIGFMGFTVWSHHMFSTGLGAIAVSAFALTTMAIAVPTGVKIFNWVGTLYNGQLVMKPPMWFALAFIFEFMIGGFSGLMHASPPHDTQQTDTYFVVAHFHYVLIGGALFGLLGGIYYWFPKITGRMLSEKTARWFFWLLIIGFNCTFFPMHWLGLNGMPRRIATYNAGMGWSTLNLLCTVGAGIMGVAFLIFFHDLGRSIRKGEPAPADPWDGRTLEWSIPSPPPPYNFEQVPTVHHLDDWWVRKYPQVLHGHEVEQSQDQAHDEGHHEHGHGIHMPGASWFPALAAFGFFWAGLAMIFHLFTFHPFRPLAEIGLLIGIYGIYCWAMEPIGGYHVHFDAATSTTAAGEGDSQEP